MGETCLINEEQEQFTRHWTQAQPSVARYVRVVVRDGDLAKDVVQETALILLRKFREWDSERPFVAWALGVAKFEILAHHRDAGRNRLVIDGALLDTITDLWGSIAGEIGDEQVAFHDCLEKLAHGEGPHRIVHSDSHECEAFQARLCRVDDFCHNLGGRRGS